MVHWSKRLRQTSCDKEDPSGLLLCPHILFSILFFFVLAKLILTCRKRHPSKFIIYLLCSFSCMFGTFYMWDGEILVFFFIKI